MRTSKKRRIPFGTIWIPPTSIRLATEAMKTRRVSSGRLVRDFEKRFAGVLKCREAVAVSSGTDADVLALATLLDFGAARGDEVIVPALSFAATGNAVVHAGFKPVFVDIERETLNIDPARIEAAITSRTVAILPVHLMGKPAPMDPILTIARRHRLKVVEDAAEAYGTLYKGRPAGTMGDMGAFSTYVAHIISTVEGGVVVTNNADYAAILRSLRSHGRACKCAVCVLNVKGKYCRRRFADPELGDIRFLADRIGYSAKMNELEAAVGLGNLDLYDTILARRRRTLLAFLDGFRAFRPHIETFAEEEGEQIGPHAMPAWVAPDAPFTRDQIVAHLEARGIDTRSLFQSMPTQCRGFAYLGYKRGQFPNAEYMGTHGFHFAVHHDMTGDDVSYVLDVIAAFLRKHR